MLHRSNFLVPVLLYFQFNEFNWIFCLLCRDSLESKQKEQADLKVEMEKMSELISDLRANCQTLQLELSEVRAVSRDRIDVAVQTPHDGSRPNARKLSTSSITEESIRKARSVYGVKQPKPRNDVKNRNGGKYFRQCRISDI